MSKLTDALFTLPRHVSITFKQHGAVWYAYWTIQGQPFARRIDGATERDLVRFQRERERLARYSPVEPRPKYSKAPTPEAEPAGECDGNHAEPAILCPTCRQQWIARGWFKEAKRRTA